MMYVTQDHLDPICHQAIPSDTISLKLTQMQCTTIKVTSGEVTALKITQE